MASSKMRTLIRRSNKQPVRWNVVMFDPQRDDWATVPYRVVARNLSEGKMYEIMTRLELSNPRMAYAGHAIKHRS